ncbi:hypothetical protein GL2_30700 [Microbulbifer sp. GL-2]|nr:hypothetical protein GL2_30700 [Microbulbifer sp. GL-2]
MIDSPTNLDQDLVCVLDEQNKVALTVVGPSGRLNLGGYAITCVTDQAFDRFGILVEGAGAAISGGMISNCPDSITVSGTGVHRVTDTEIVNFTGNGIIATSDSNKNYITRVTATGAGPDSNDGIRIDGNYSTVANCFIFNAGDRGIVINGNHVNIYDNYVTGSINEGIEIDGDFVTTKLNAIENNGKGIGVSGNNNSVIENTVINNGSGLSFNNADNGLIAKNEILDNGSYGIQIVSIEATNNKFIGNRVLGHTKFNLYDPLTTKDCNLSNRSPNIWANNESSSSSPGCLD